MGLKLEGGFRYTMTDYLDDVSGVYYDRNAIEEQYGNLAATMSGTNSGNIWENISYTASGNPLPDGATSISNSNDITYYSQNLTYTEPGYQRGNPKNKDSYAYVTLSLYKKLKSRTRQYRRISMHHKRKVKASF